VKLNAKSLDVSAGFGAVYELTHVYMTSAAIILH
jgi:hypothetical protein